MEGLSLYIIDDEAAIRETLTRWFTQKECQVESFSEPQSALERIEEKPPHFVFLDLMLPQMSGIDVLRLIREKAPESIVIMISGYGTIETSVEALKLGAADFLTKPLDLENVEVLLQKYVETFRLKEELHRLRFQEEDRFLSSHVVPTLKLPLRNPRINCVPYRNFS